MIFSIDCSGQSVRAAHGAGHGYHPELPDMMTASSQRVRASERGWSCLCCRFNILLRLLQHCSNVGLPAADGTLLLGLVAAVLKQNDTSSLAGHPAPGGT